MGSRTALISGGTSGIGRGTVFQLLQDGFNVATFAPDSDRCGELTQALTATYGEDRFLVVPGNVADERNMKSIVGKTVEKFGTIDVLVNNAGFGFFTGAEEVNKEEWQKMFDVNVVGMGILTKHVVPHMKTRKSGLIINIASATGRTAGAKAKAEFYAATKFAVMGYSEGLRAELREFGIKVSTVCPGLVKTNFFTPEEIERRKKELWENGEEPPMLSVSDVVRAISFIYKQSERSDIRDIFVMPF